MRDVVTILLVLLVFVLLTSQCTPPETATVVMPGMGGRKCLEELLKINPDAKVLIATGHSPDGPTTEFLKDGAKAFVNKPYDMTQMLRAVREILDKS